MENPSQYVASSSKGRAQFVLTSMICMYSVTSSRYSSSNNDLFSLGAFAVARCIIDTFELVIAFFDLIGDAGRTGASSRLLREARVVEVDAEEVDAMEV